MRIIQPIRLLLLSVALCSLGVLSASEGKKTENTTESTQQKTKLKGTVTDALGPVIGASVTIKDVSTRGAVTDADGNFTLEVSNGETLRITFLGYTPQEIKYTGQEAINFLLKEDSFMLDEFVVVGYGIQKKANLTGSVASVNASAIESRSVSSVSAALAGQMPGVTAIQSSGAPGAQKGTITIRGKNSINTAEPLIVIDGVPSSAESMNSLDPMDIESLSVLKDAASSAIYGVQAANGVIVVTTKKGSLNQKARINYSGSVAWSRPVTRLNFLGAADYATLYDEAGRNDAKDPSAYIRRFTEEQIEGYRNGTLPDTDWYKETFRSSATETYHNLSITGGSNKTSYNGAIGYTRQGSLADQDENYERFNLRVGLDSKINNWLSAGLNVSGYRGTNKTGWSGYSSLHQMTNRIAPIYPVYNEDGTYYYSGQDNPVALRGQSGVKKTVTQEENAQAYLTVNIFPELSVKGLFSVRHNDSKINNFKKRVIYGAGSNIGDTGDREGEARNNDNNWYTGQLIANYNKTFFKDHSIGVLLGYEQTEYKYKYLKVTRKGGGSDELPETISSLNEASNVVENKGYEYARRSVFGRVQYDYQNKYLFEVNVRRDASSRFHKDNRWGTFPAVSAGWRVTQESFMENVNWLSNLKLRVGYGKTGNEEMASDVNYPTIFSYSFDKYYLGNTLYSTTMDSRMAEPGLTWANVTNYELGLDASFLNNLIGFELELYKKKTTDMLLKPSVPGVLGQDPGYLNAGEVTNRGFDLSLFHHKTLNNDWSYAVNFNLSYVKNELTNMLGGNMETPETDGKRWFLEGSPIGSFYGYQANGFFNTLEEVKNSAVHQAVKPGDIKYVDQPGANGKGDGVINSADRVAIGKNFPDWTAGMNINVFYKDFDLSMLFQGAFGASAYLTGEASYSFYNGGKVLERHLDRWTEDNKGGSFPNLTLKGNSPNYVNSSFWLQKTDYVRLKNLSVGYNLPKLVLNKVGMEKAKIYLSGENLFTISDLDGIDPEAPSNTRGGFYGNVKKISLGLKVTF